MKIHNENFLIVMYIIVKQVNNSYIILENKQILGHVYTQYASTSHTDF